MFKKEKFEINRKGNIVIWSDIIKVKDKYYLFNAPVELRVEAVETKEFPYLGKDFETIDVHLASLGLVECEPLYDCDNYFLQAAKKFGVSDGEISSFMFGDVSEDELLNCKNIRDTFGVDLLSLLPFLGGYINGVNY